MNYKIISALTVLALLIVFSMQNTNVIDLKLFAWEFTGSLSLFLLVSVFTGIIIGVIFSKGFRNKVKKEKNTILEEEKSAKN